MIKANTPNMIEMDFKEEWLLGFDAIVVGAFRLVVTAPVLLAADTDRGDRLVVVRFGFTASLIALALGIL